jgi:hypothetical protein
MELVEVEREERSKLARSNKSEGNYVDIYSHLNPHFPISHHHIHIIRMILVSFHQYATCVPDRVVHVKILMG